MQFVGAALTQRLLRNADAYVSALHPLHGGSDSIQIGITVLLGQRTSANAQWAQENGQGVRRYAFQHVPNGPIGLSAQAAVDDSANGVRMADAQWGGALGAVGIGVEGNGGHVEPAASLRTGVAVLGGDPYWTRPVEGSFAVVDAGTPGVHVYRDNLEVGRTNDAGRLLVPDLRPFDTNRLSIDDRDLPIDRGIEHGEEAVAPPFGAGVLMRFALDRAVSVRLHLRDERGQPVPAGSELLLDGRRLLLPVGRDGLAYIQVGADARRLEARWAGHRCVSALAHRGATVTAGVCRSEAS